MGTFSVGCLIKNHVDRDKLVRIPREIEGHPVAKAIVPGKVPPDKDQLPPFTGVVIQGQAGPPPRAASPRKASRAPTRGGKAA